MPSKELIVLIPGLARVAQFQQGERFLQGLEQVSESRTVRQTSTPPASSGAVTLEVVDGAEMRTVDVVEAFWNDMVPSLTQEGVRTKVFRGLSLLSYWGRVRVWKGAARRKYLTIGTSVSALTLVVWYWGVVALFLQAVVGNPTANPDASRLASFGLTAISWMAGWKVWVGASVLMGIIPVALLVDIMDFAKRYLTEEVSGTDAVSLRFRIIDRVRQQVRAALAAKLYERLTIVGHSFGSVIAVDLMADLELPDGMTFRLITMGSPIELMARNAEWLSDEVRRCGARNELEEWVAVESDVDWLASGVGFPEGLSRCRTEMVRSPGIMLDHLAARTHSRYFDNQRVVDIVLA